MCHRTAGLVVDALEEAGIPTACVGTMHAPLKGLPRVVVTPHGRGSNFGAPHDRAEHRRIVDEVLSLFAS